MSTSPHGKPPEWMHRLLQRACLHIEAQWPLRQSSVAFAMYLDRAEAGGLPPHVESRRKTKPAQFRARVEFSPFVVKVHDDWSGALVCQSLPGQPDRLDPACCKLPEWCE